MIANDCSVVWEEAVRTCWIDDICIESSLTCIWSFVFNGNQIPNQVLKSFSYLDLWQQFSQSPSFYVSQVVVIDFLPILQHTQGILLSPRNFFTNNRSYWEVATWGAWSPCHSTRGFVWSTSIWRGTICIQGFLDFSRLR